MLRVVVDARMAFHSGIGRYVRGLTRELSGRDDVALSLLVDPRRERLVRESTGVRDCVAFPAAVLSLAEQWSAPGVCRRAAGGGAVVHFPHFNAPWALPRPSVVTVHDVIPFGDPAYFGRLRTRLALGLLRRVCRRATRLVAVSDATRRSLAELVPESAARIRTVHLGVDPVFRDGDRGADERPGGPRYFLFVGRDRPHKNLACVLEAFAAARAHDPEVELCVLDGEDPGTARRPDAAPGVRRPGRRSDRELARLYGNAVALVMPSLEEGFGLPALEAMACGTPVIAGSRPAQQEVAGDAALLVDPSDTGELARAMIALLADRDLARELAERGRRRAERFSWQRTAERTVEVYREAAAATGTGA